MKRLILLMLMFVFVGAGQLWGAEVAVEGVWKSNLELGYVQTGGNTQVRSLNTKGKMINDGKSFRTTAEGTALNTTDKSVTTAERYSASLQEDWKFTEYDYAFIRAGFDTDRFGGFKRRISETLGYGRTLLKQDGLDWNIELGSGARQTTLTSNKKTNELIGRVASNLKWKINDNASFIQEFKAEGGKEGVVSNSLTALQNKISGHLSSKISYAIQHTSKVPVGTKKDNTEFSVALVWSY